jgi:hypothetical protein
MMRFGSLGSFPLHKKILMNLIMSSAVENNPECPATPPKKYANLSWASPRTILFLVSKSGVVYMHRIQWEQHCTIRFDWD